MDGNNGRQSTTSLFSFFSTRVQSSASSDTDVQGQARPSTSTTEEQQPAIDEPSPETPVNAERLSKKCRHDKFCEGWLKDFSWLQTDREMTMFCSICLKTKKKSGFIRGSRNYQYSALAENAMSVSHKAAVVTTSKQTSMVPHSESACAGEKECLQVQAQLRTVLCMVKNNIPADNFVSLLELKK